MSAPVDVLAVLRNAVCELECHEKGTLPRTNEGLRGHGWATAEEVTSACAAVAELIEAATSAKNALAIIAGSEESDTSDKWYQLLFDDLPRLRAALAKATGA